MRYGTRPSRRTGFTLVELLVVMAILALLAALTAAGIAAVRTATMNKATGQTVTKLQKALDQQVRAVVEEANRDSNPHLSSALIGFCDGDKDRAKALLTYLYLRWEFPQTFVEATSPVLLPAGTGSVLTLPARKSFNAVLTNGAASDEAAVLLYLALTEKGNRGTGIAMDDVTSSAQTDLGKYKVFKDAYGTPITFRRWFQNPNGELNQAPYVNPNAKPLGNPLLDPFDRLSIDQTTGKLRNWNLTNPTNQGLAVAALTANGGPAVSFDGLNKVLTVIAAGETKGFPTAPSGNDGYVYGYRLARIGNQGN